MLGSRGTEREPVSYTHLDVYKRQAQSRVTMIAGARDDIRRAHYQRACSRDNLEQLREHVRAPATRAFAAAPSHDLALSLIHI